MKTEIKWGLIFSMVSLLWIVGEYLVGLHDRYIDKQQILTNLFFFPAVLMMYLAIREKRQMLGGQITFMAALTCGFAVSVVVAILAPLIQYVFHTWINPHFFEKLIEYSTGKAGGSGTGIMTVELASRHFSLGNYMLMSSMGAITAGVSTSLVLGYLMRSRNSQR